VLPVLMLVEAPEEVPEAEVEDKFVRYVIMALEMVDQAVVVVAKAVKVVKVDTEEEAPSGFI